MTVAGAGLALAVDDTLSTFVVCAGVTETLCFTSRGFALCLVGVFAGVWCAGIIGATTFSVGVIARCSVTISTGFPCKACLTCTRQHAIFDFTRPMSVARIALADLIFDALSVLFVVSCITETCRLFVFYKAVCAIGLCTGIGEAGIISAGTIPIGVVALCLITFVAKRPLVSLIT